MGGSVPKAANRPPTLTIEPSSRTADAFKKLANALRRPAVPGETDWAEASSVLAINGEEVRVPAQAAELLEAVGAMLAGGEEVTITTTRSEIRTGEAARLLNVSRQYLVRLCDEGVIPYRVDGPGGQRRLARQDVLDYRRKRDEARRVKFREYVAEVAASGEYGIPDTWDPTD